MIETEQQKLFKIETTEKDKTHMFRYNLIYMNNLFMWGNMHMYLMVY